MNALRFLLNLFVQTARTTGWLQTLQDEQANLRADLEVTRRDVAALQRYQAQRESR